FEDEWNHGGYGVHAHTIGGRRIWTRDIEALHEQLAKQKREVAARGREMKLIRPAWSSWPDPSASADPRAGPGMARTWSSLLAGAVVALIVGLPVAVAAVARRTSTGEASPEGTGPDGPPSRDG
ncbi:MAG: hypothetical protein ACYS9X_13380, partial [Planctomycetota bacterium]